MKLETNGVSFENKKVFVTKDYKFLVKPDTFVINKDKIRNQIKVSELVGNYEVPEIDENKNIAVNEHYYFQENDADAKSKYETLQKLENHSDMLTSVGQKVKNAQMKSKLLNALKQKKVVDAEVSDAFDKKYELLLKKNNNDFIKKVVDRTRSLRASIGLNFAGTLLEAITETDTFKLETLHNFTKLENLKLDIVCERFHVLSDKLCMITRDSDDPETWGVNELYFYEMKFDKDAKKLEFSPLQTPNLYYSKEYIYDAKYYPDSDMLVLMTNVQFEEITIVKINKLIINGSELSLEPVDKVTCYTQQTEIMNFKGSNYIPYTMVEEEEGKQEFSLLNLTEIFENPQKERIESVFPCEVRVRKVFRLNNNLLLVKGYYDDMAVFDLDQHSFVASFVGKRKSDNFEVYRACYVRSQNKLVLLANNNNGGEMSIFKINYTNEKIEHLQDFDLSSSVKNNNVNQFLNQFWELQYNAEKREVVVVDNNFQKAVYFKFDSSGKLAISKGPLDLTHFVARDCDPWGVFLKIDDQVLFLYLFTYKTDFRVYMLEKE